MQHSFHLRIYKCVALGDAELYLDDANRSPIAPG
jgi:hypothetical protein